MRVSASDIRTAIKAELPAISTLIQRTIEVSNARDYAPEQIAETVASFGFERLRQRLEGRDAFVCVEKDAIVGFVSFNRETGRLHSLFVDPDRQRGGIGRDLVAHVEDHASDVGITDIVLSSSLTAVGFYEKLGYQRLGVETHDVHGSTYPMRKHLPVNGFNRAISPQGEPALKVN